MEYIVIASAALLTAGLTLFSGFGLGTLLMPAFALFFPINLAIALTAVVHLANNLFKVGLLFRDADKPTILRFGAPAIVAAFLGAAVLLWLSDVAPLASYEFMGREAHVTLVKAVLAALIMFFALFELIPQFEKLTFDRKYLPLGGALSGFFGGLSGHQGALRSAFLVKTGLTKEAFVATGATIAALVDISRLAIYGTAFLATSFRANAGLVLVAVLFAFAGTFIGSRLVRKVTMRTVQAVVSVMLVVIAVGLGTGVI